MVALSSDIANLEEIIMVQKQKESFIKPFIKPVGWWPVMLGTTMVVTTGVVTFYTSSRLQLSSKVEPLAIPNSSLQKTAIAALGRLEPQGKRLLLQL